MFALPPAFAGLDPEDTQPLMELLQPIDFPPSELVMGEGEEDFSLAFVLTGTLSIERNGIRIGGAGARDMLGEIELFMGIPRQATATTNSACRLLVLPPEAYGELCETGHPAVYNIERAALRRVAERLKFVNQGIQDKATGTPFKLHPAAKPGLFKKITSVFTGRAPKIDVDAAAVLRSSRMFDWAEPSLVNAIAEKFLQEHVPKESVIVRQGQEGDRMYVVAEGKVDVVLFIGDKSAETVATLGPGDAFGDAAMAQSGTRTASVVCHEDVELLTLPRDEYLALHEVNDAVGSTFRQGMIRNLAQQLLTATEKIVDLEAHAGDEREQKLRGTPVSAIWRD